MEPIREAGIKAYCDGTPRAENPQMDIEDILLWDEGWTYAEDMYSMPLPTDAEIEESLDAQYASMMRDAA